MNRRFIEGVEQSALSLKFFMEGVNMHKISKHEHSKGGYYYTIVKIKLGRPNVGIVVGQFRVKGK